MRKEDGEEEKRKGMRRAQYAADRRWWVCCWKAESSLRSKKRVSERLCK